MLVTGGLAVWKGFAVVSCYDINYDKEELRFYPFDRQLDNQYCTKHATHSRVLMLSRRFAFSCFIFSFRCTECFWLIYSVAFLLHGVVVARTLYDLYLQGRQNHYFRYG